MSPPRDYVPEPFIEAVTNLDWSTEHPTDAVKVIQSTGRDRFGEELSDEDALKLLGQLIDRRIIRTLIHPDAMNIRAPYATRRLAKYVRVSPAER